MQLPNVSKLIKGSLKGVTHNICVYRKLSQQELTRTMQVFPSLSTMLGRSHQRATSIYRGCSTGTTPSDDLLRPRLDLDGPMLIDHVCRSIKSPGAAGSTAVVS
jgi:hypothetical protein